MVLSRSGFGTKIAWDAMSQANAIRFEPRRIPAGWRIVDILWVAEKQTLIQVLKRPT